MKGGTQVTLQLTIQVKPWARHTIGVIGWIISRLTRLLDYVAAKGEVKP